MIIDIDKIVRRVKQLKIAIIVISAVLAFVFATTAFAASNIITTTVYCDEEECKVTSFSSDPYDIIEKAGIEISDADLVDFESFDPQSDESVIKINKAYEILIFDSDNEPLYVFCAGTVSRVLELSGITLNKYDKLNVSKDSEITKDMFIVISRAVKVTLTVDGKKKSYKTAEKTVGDFLESVGVELSDDDIVTKDLDAKIKKNMKIQVKRVTYKTVEKEESVPYETITVKTDELFLGKTQVLQEGVNGTQVSYYTQKYIDGELSEETLEKTEVTKSPTYKFVLKGTRVNPISSDGSYSSIEKSVISELAPTVDIELDENGRPKNYKKLITGKATAYCTGTVTATGQKAMPGRVAVNPNQIPYGTKMYIVSADGKYVYGYCEASDTGGFAKKGTAVVDLFMRSYDDCIQFGRRTVEIYILE